MATAFIVDAAGRVAPRSITFLGSPPAPFAFRASRCEFLPRVLFAPLIRDGQRRRAFVLQPFGFGPEGGKLYGETPDAREQREAVRRVALDSVFTLLDRQPHC